MRGMEVPRPAPGDGKLGPMDAPHRTVPQRYPRLAILLHWSVAALVISLVALGWWMQEIPKQPPGARAAAFNFHKSLGLAALGVITLLTAWRATHKPPQLPPMPRWQARSAHALHIALYVLLVVTAVSGYLGSAYSGYPVKFFGVTLPAWAGKHGEMKELMSLVHFWSSWVLTAAVLVHVGAVLKHVLVGRDALLRRMAWRATSSLRGE
jgi:cytochrome b561